MHESPQGKYNMAKRSNRFIPMESWTCRNFYLFPRMSSRVSIELHHEAAVDSTATGSSLFQVGEEACHVAIDLDLHHETAAGPWAVRSSLSPMGRGAGEGMRSARIVGASFTA
jgi:hypothetical protein